MLCIVVVHFSSKQSLCIFPLYEYCLHIFISFPVDGHLGCFRFGAVRIVMLSWSVIYMVIIFSQAMSLHFYFLICLLMKKLLILMMIYMCDFFFMITALCTLLKKSCLPQGHEDFFLCFLVEFFVVVALHFMFRSIIIFNWIFCLWREIERQCVFFHKDMQLTQQHLLERPFPPTHPHWILVTKSIDHISRIYSFLFIGLFVYPYTNQMILIFISLQWSSISDSISPPTLLFLFLIFFNWRIIALKHCVGFCHTSIWISHRYTYIPSLLKPLSSPSPSQPSRLSQSTDLNSLCHTANSHLLSILRRYTDSQQTHKNMLSSVPYSHSVVSNSLWHTRLPCPSPTPGACSNSCPSRSRWCHPTVSSSVAPLIWLFFNVSWHCFVVSSVEVLHLFH